MLLAWQMAFGDNHVATIDPVTRSRDDGAVKRSIAVFEKGVIVSYAVAVTGAATALVKISDTLPANWDVDTVAFHPEHEPDDGTADRNTVEFTVRADPDQYRMVKVGARPALDKTVSEIESDQSFSVPQIVDVDPVRGGDAADGGPPLIDGPPGTVTADDSPSPAADASQPTNDAGDGGDAGPAEADDSDGILPADDAVATVGADPSTNAPEVDPDEADSVRDLFGGFQDAARPGASRHDPSPTDGRSPASPNQDSPTASPTAGRPPSPGAGSAPAGESAAGTRRQPHADGLLPSLLDELEGGDPSPADLDRLRAVLGQLLDGATRNDHDQSTAVRIERLESKLEEFEAYTDALGKLVDVDDPAAQLADNRAELESLSQEVSALRQDVKAIHDRQDTLDVRIESIVSDLEHLVGSQHSP